MKQYSKILNNESLDFIYIIVNKYKIYSIVRIIMTSLKLTK